MTNPKVPLAVRRLQTVFLPGPFDFEAEEEGDVRSFSSSHSIGTTSRLLQDKYSHYLDEIELLITRSLSTKSDCFHDAVRSHDEIQSFLDSTRQAICSLRCQLIRYDDESLLTLLRLTVYLRQRRHQCEILRRLQSLSIVKQTHLQVRSLLRTSDYLSALDLIDGTKDLLNTQLTHLSALRFYETQLNEMSLLIVNLMREEFLRSLEQELTTSRSGAEEDFDEEKFVSIFIGLIRVHDEKYLSDLREKIEESLLDRLERTLANQSKDLQSTIKSNKSPAEPSDESSSFNARYTFPSSIQSNSSCFSSWFRLLTNLCQTLEESLQSLSNLLELIGETLSKHHPADHALFISMLDQVYDRLQDRLISLFVQESSRFQVHCERLSLKEFSQLVLLIDGFTRKEIFAKRKYSSRPLKTFLQTQTSKFLTYFHDQRKQRIANTLDNEQWKQVPIPRSIQNSIDELFQLPSSSSSSQSNALETLTIVGEPFVLCNSVLHLFMLVLDYRSCAQMFSSGSISDVEHRLIELLNLFNSKTCQLVLGAGAVKLGKIKTISAKILAITCRCLQFIKAILPKIKTHFDQLQVSAPMSKL